MGQAQIGRPWARPKAGPAIIESILRGADLHENQLVIEELGLSWFLSISGPSRPQKWIRLEISVILVVSGGLYDENKSISWQIYDLQ